MLLVLAEGFLGDCLSGMIRFVKRMFTGKCLLYTLSETFVSVPHLAQYSVTWQELEMLLNDFYSSMIRKANVY